MATPHVYQIGAPGFCVSYRPGHVVHFIHARRGVERSSPLQVDGEVDVRTGTVRLGGPDVGPQFWRNHDPRRVFAALQLSVGRAVWFREYRLLRIPGRAGESFLFNLARPQDWVPCRPPERPPDADVPDLQTAPCVFPRPRTGQDAEAWAQLVPGHLEALRRDRVTRSRIRRGHPRIHAGSDCYG